MIQFAAGRGRDQVGDIETIPLSDVGIQTSPAVKSRDDSRPATDTRPACGYWLTSVKHATFTREHCHVGPSLSDDVIKTVACNVVSSRLNHCKSLLADMSALNFKERQHTQNTLVHVVLHRDKYDHVSSGSMNYAGYQSSNVFHSK